MLIGDPENIVVVHCNSGKGRAGSVTICLLMYLGFYDNAYDCARYFSSKRFTDGKGISQPCQVRYIHYYEAFLNRIVISPQVKYLRRIVLKEVPITSQVYNGCNKPFFEVYRMEGLELKRIYHNLDMKEQVRFYGEDEGTIELRLPGKLRIYGNIMIKFKFHSTFSTADLFRVQFNTAFIGTDNTLHLSRWEISPEACQKDYERFSDNFQCTFLFDNYCKKGCASHVTPVSALCLDCKTVMKDDVERWQVATECQESRPSHHVSDARAVLSGNEEAIMEAEDHEIRWESRRGLYKITEEMFGRPERMKTI